MGDQCSPVCLIMIFHDVKLKSLYHYSDNLVTYSENSDQHLEHVSQGVSSSYVCSTVIPSKTTLNVGGSLFLGDRVPLLGVSRDPDRTEAIRNFPQPKDAKWITRLRKVRSCCWIPLPVALCL